MKVRRKIIVVVVIIMAFALLPCLSLAGSLEPTPDAVDPSGNPVPTMRTLNEIPPAWSKKLPCDSAANCPRFEVLADFNDEAVLDRETGLVWERAPRTYTGDWWHAQWECWAHNTGGRWGWRLPTVSELESLSEYCVETGKYLPCGHPFTNAICTYWSATTWFWDSNRAISFSRLGSDVFLKDFSELCYWCVRGGTGSNYASD